MDSVGPFRLQALDGKRVDDKTGYRVVLFRHLTDGSPQVTWRCQIWLKPMGWRTCQAAGCAGLLTANLSSCDVLRPGVLLCYVKGRVTSGSDVSCYVTQRRVDLPVWWITAGYVDLSNMIKTANLSGCDVLWTCRVVLRKEFLEVARGVR